MEEWIRKGQWEISNTVAQMNKSVFTAPSLKFQRTNKGQLSVYHYYVTIFSFIILFSYKKGKLF